MDIVQYLHSLVSTPLGVLDDHAQADLLKNYYALSIAHLANHPLPTETSPRAQHLWGDQTPRLTQQLARSFHIDQVQTLALLDAATPAMLTELSNLSDNLAQFIAQNFADSRGHLPVWAGNFVSLPNADIHQTSSSDDEDLSSIESPSNQTPQKPTSPKINAQKPIGVLPIMLGALLGAAVVGAGAFWYISSQKPAPVAAANTAQTAPVSTTNPPRLSITTGENNTLYACQAEIGNQELQNQLLQTLQKNFSAVKCVMQINHHFGTTLAGLERLDSIIAMIKSEPFSTLEVVGNRIFINSPKPEIISRMVDDIKRLAPQFEVSAAPALDKASATTQSLERASSAINALSTPINALDLSWAASLQILDFNGTTQLPTQNQAVLELLAQKLKENPQIRLIIATHTDASNPDRMANINLSQAQAEAVKNFLIQKGVADNQLVAKGVGDAFAVADNLTDLGKFKNRRTEFLVFDEGILSALSSESIQITPATPVVAAPVVAAPVTTQNLPVQGMPSGVVAPEPVYQAEQLPSNYQPASPVPEPTPAPAPAPMAQRTTTTAPSKTANIPADVLELSQTTIGSEGNIGTSEQLAPIEDN